MKVFEWIIETIKMIITSQHKTDGGLDMRYSTSKDLSSRIKTIGCLAFILASAIPVIIGIILKFSDYIFQLIHSLI